MNPRLLLLALVAVGLGVALLVKKTAPKATETGLYASDEDDDGPQSVGASPGRKKLLTQLPPPPGDPPPEEPEFVVDVRVMTATGKNRLCFDITETHGFYVASMRLKMRRLVRDDKTGEVIEKLELPRDEYIDDYIKAKETLTHCFELVKPEIDRLGGDMGRDEDWEAEILWYHTVRAENPDPLPIATIHP